MEAEACADHIHILNKYSTVHRIPKRKSSVMIFDRYENLKYKYGTRNFECRRELGEVRRADLKTPQKVDEADQGRHLLDEKMR